MSKSMKMFVEVLLDELKRTKKDLKTASGISSEKTVQHYLNGTFIRINELVEATEKELGGNQ